MNNLLDDPERIFEYARLYPVSVACTLLYGPRAKDLDSFWYKDFYAMMEKVSEKSVSRPASRFLSGRLA
jgi:hypothetical protein